MDPTLHEPGRAGSGAIGRQSAVRTGAGSDAGGAAAAGKSRFSGMAGGAARLVPLARSARGELAAGRPHPFAPLCAAAARWRAVADLQIGRASCREIACQYVQISGAGAPLQKTPW